MTETFKALILAFKQMAKDRGEPETMEKLTSLYVNSERSRRSCTKRKYPSAKNSILKWKSMRS